MAAKRRTPMSIADKSYARYLGLLRFRRGDLKGAWEMYRRYDELVLLEFARSARRRGV